jgi:hypothetical protein
MRQSGRAILTAIVAGETNPEQLVILVSDRVSEMVEALRGRVAPHHRFLLQFHLDQVATLEEGDREGRRGDGVRASRPFAPPPNG